ncbi:hypothetical protein BHM03_00042270, partial [Ensete ventricosum]
MGVISRRVLPACGYLCCFCPSLRTRSRQPVKRYKKLLTDAFPRSPIARYQAVPLIGAVFAPLPLKIDFDRRLPISGGISRGREKEEVGEEKPGDWHCSSPTRSVARGRFLLPARGEETRR